VEQDAIRRYENKVRRDCRVRCAGEEYRRDRDDCLRSLFILAAVVNACLDGDGEDRHTGGVGSLSRQSNSIREYGETVGIVGFAADRSAYTRGKRFGWQC